MLSAAIAVGSCWTSYSPKFQYMQYAPERSGESHQCRILDSTPFFGTTPRDVDGLKEQLLFLTEFSRFMNSKSLSLLWVTRILNIQRWAKRWTGCAEQKPRIFCNLCLSFQPISVQRYIYIMHKTLYLTFSLHYHFPLGICEVKESLRLEQEDIKVNARSVVARIL